LTTQNLLGASFFFKRGEGDRGSARRFFPTIIRQLVRVIPGLGALVTRAVKSYPFIFDNAPAEQFRRLMLQPLQDLTVSNVQQSTLFVVVDALDECEKEDDVRAILELWSQLSQLTSVRLRLFLTSRPELAIRLEFAQMSVDRFRDIDLVDAVPSNTIQNDLSVYLNDSFCSIRENHNRLLQGTVMLSTDWADRGKIQQLVEMAVPLFIVAATICRFVGDLSFDPHERLEKILQNRSIGQMSQMELTYRPVLDYLTDQSRDEESRKDLCHDFHAVVGSIVVLAEPLSVSSLAILLGRSPQSIVRRLVPLHSVLRIPADPNCDAPIRTLHLSFAEFLLGDRAQKQPFGIDGPSTHLALSRHCLRVLSYPNGVRKNICKLNYPGQPRSGVASTIITDQLYPALQYACQYWVHHVKHSLCQIEDFGEVHGFLQEHFLHWLEALSLMDRLSEAIHLLGILQSCVSVSVQQIVHPGERS
jgi:hypothetical protein